MKTNEIISSAMQMAESVKNAELVSALKKVAEEISGDTLKVVVLGDFKAGKSTLINTLFLKDNLLPVDYLEATAVPTHLSSGETRLQTWLRGEDGKSTLQNEWTDFDQEQVKSIVTADTEEARAAIAEKYSHVCISKPGILPSGITLVDTPGLNTTNQRIYVGTMEEARTAHAILYVVRGRQLSERELSLLADMAGMQQPSLPIHVVVSEDNTHGAGQLQNLCSTIKAQLSSAGISQCGVSVFTVGSTGSVSINTSEGEWGEDLIGDPIAPQASQTDTGDITKDLEAFFNGPVRQGRAIRQVRDLRPLLGRLLVALESCVNLAGENEEKLHDLEANLQQKKHVYAEQVREMLSELHHAQCSMEEGVIQEMDKLHVSYEKKVDKCETLQDVHTLLDSMNENLDDDIGKIIRNASTEFKLEVMRISNAFGQKLTEGISAGEKMPFELQSNFLKLVSWMPSIVITALDLLLVGPAIPGGIFFDIIARWIGGQLPLIKKIMPTSIGAMFARKFVKEELEKHFTQFKKELSKKIETNFDEICSQMSGKAMQSSGFSEMEHAVQMARSGAISDAEKARLQEKIALCKQWMTAL